MAAARQVPGRDFLDQRHGLFARASGRLRRMGGAGRYRLGLEGRAALFPALRRELARRERISRRRRAAHGDAGGRGRADLRRDHADRAEPRLQGGRRPARGRDGRRLRPARGHGGKGAAGQRLLAVPPPGGGPAQPHRGDRAAGDAGGDRKRPRGGRGSGRRQGRHPPHPCRAGSDPQRGRLQFAQAAAAFRDRPGGRAARAGHRSGGGPARRGAQPAGTSADRRGV